MFDLENLLEVINQTDSDTTLKIIFNNSTLKSLIYIDCTW